jgi:hypothetical protein
MNTTAGGPTVDRTLTGVLETLALTSASVAEEPRGDPTMVESLLDSKAETSPDGRGRPPIVWGRGIQIWPSMNLPQPSDSSSRPSARLPISQASVKIRIQKELDRRKADHDDLRH